MITKKLVCVLLACLLLFGFTVPCFAASGVNNAEMQVLKMMDRGAKIDPGFYQYRNALKNYFNRDSVSITQVMADTTCEYLLAYYDSYNPDDVNKEKKFFDQMIYVLMYVGVRVVYDRANSTADLIGIDNSIVMTQLDLSNLSGGGRTVKLNPIKQTGPSVNWWGWASIGMVAVLSIGAYIFIIGKERIHGN